MASCFIWAHLDLIFKWRTEAESINAVTMATELMGHTHSVMNDRTVCGAFVIAGRENGWCGRNQSRATQQSAPGDERHLGSSAGFIQISFRLWAGLGQMVGEGSGRGGVNRTPAFVITISHLNNSRYHLQCQSSFICFAIMLPD